MHLDDATFEPVREWSDYPPVAATIRAGGPQGWLRRISPIVMTHRWRISWSVLAALVAMVAQILVPRVIGLAIDGALIDQSGSLWIFVLTLLILGAARAGATFGYRYGLYGMAFKVEYQLRTLLFEHLGRLSFAFYDRVQSGQIISRANSDIRSVQMFMAFAPIMAVQFLSFVIAIGLMAAISLPLTAITMVALPGVFAIGQRLRTIMFPLSWVVQSRQAEIATVVDESVSGVRVVKAFAAERQQIEALARGAERLRWANLLQHRTRASHTPFIENLPRLALAAVLLVGGQQVINGSLSVGDLVSFNLYILLLQAPFRFVGMLLILGQRAKASAERIYEVLDEPPGTSDKPGAVDLVPAGGAISFSKVGFAYGTETVGGKKGVEEPPRVLHNFELEILAGQSIAIVGRTGSGKSTVARLLMRFYDLQQGSILLDGQDIASVTQASLRSTVGLVPDEPFLFSTSVHDNIAYGQPGASRSSVEKAARAAQAHEFIVCLENGYDTIIGERGYDLSGGQRQRISLARLFLQDPSVIILDDSTSSIDVEIEEQIHRSLRELLKDRTTIVIAHRLSTIGLAQRVVLVEDGHIVADGSHQYLMDSEPRYVEALAASVTDDGDRAW
ncbi:MAG TPA: ABC transporter ATP-binding protein [Acidimicrobiales bacterium]|jgi:ATP-binding cassette subfamily B protein|nr:ABC transporter ATP-binding protein [Acidimicrobiales bacterium]